VSTNNFIGPALLDRTLREIIAEAERTHAVGIGSEGPHIGALGIVTIHVGEQARIADAGYALLVALEELVARRDRAAKRYCDNPRVLAGSDGRYARARLAIARARGQS
jgi:hypothetical protein